MRIYPCKVVIRSQQVNSRQFRIFEFRSMVLPILLEKQRCHLTNGFQVATRLFSNRSHFDILCDLLQNRHSNLEPICFIQ